MGGCVIQAPTEAIHFAAAGIRETGPAFRDP